MERRRIFYERPFKFILIPVGIAAILTLVSYIVMQLWNNLLPAILHVSAITFWQAMGIFVLCKILFGFGKGGRGFGNRENWFMRRRMEEKFEKLSPEERERFKQKMNDRMCRHRGQGWGNSGWGEDQPKPEEQKASE